VSTCGWGVLVVMATPGVGVNLHYAEAEAPAGAVRWMRASCGVEDVGLVLEWNLRLPRKTSTCDRCFVTLPAQRPVH
jgi:hypothetical protein